MTWLECLYVFFLIMAIIPLAVFVIAAFPLFIRDLKIISGYKGKKS